MIYIYISFKIYSLSRFQIYNIVLLTLGTVLSITSYDLFILLNITSYALFIYWRLVPFDFLHPFHPPLTSGNHLSILCTSEFCLFMILDSTCKWDHTVFVVFCLTYFTQHNALKVHLCCCKWQNFHLFMAE